MSLGVVVAHPDDEVLGCGGLIARYAKREAVHTLILGEGAMARYSRRSAAGGRVVRRLRAQAEAAAAILGARSVTFGGLPDNRFDEIPLLSIIKRIEGWLKHTGVDAVYTHHPGDLNIDHGLTFRAVLTATRPVKGCRVRELYACEVPSSTEWAFQRVEPPFRPTVFVDISGTLPMKIRALQCYEGEIRPAPHPRSSDILRATARRWGSVAGLEYAEPFELIRSVRS